MKNSKIRVDHTRCPCEKNAVLVKIVEEKGGEIYAKIRL